MPFAFCSVPKLKQTLTCPLLDPLLNIYANVTHTRKYVGCLCTKKQINERSVKSRNSNSHYTDIHIHTLKTFSGIRFHISLLLSQNYYYYITAAQNPVEWSGTGFQPQEKEIFMSCVWKISLFTKYFIRQHPAPDNFKSDKTVTKRNIVQWE